MPAEENHHLLPRPKVLTWARKDEAQFAIIVVRSNDCGRVRVYLDVGDLDSEQVHHDGVTGLVQGDPLQHHLASLHP